MTVKHRAAGWAVHATQRGQGVWVGGFIKRVTVNGSHVRVTAGQFGHPRLTGSRGRGAALDTKEPGAEMLRVGPGASGSPDTLLSPLI